MKTLGRILTGMIIAMYLILVIFIGYRTIVEVEDPKIIIQVEEPQVDLIIKGDSTDTLNVYAR